MITRVPRFVLIASFLGLLTACGSTPQSIDTRSSVPTDTTVKNQFESAIAESILEEIHTNLPELTISERIIFLGEKLKQFERDVDRNLITSRLKQEYQLLRQLWLQESAAASNAFGARMRSMTSLDWSLQNYSKAVRNEIMRLDQTIIVLASKQPDSFDLTAHIAEVRRDSIYPTNSFSGRQNYLDDLFDAMVDNQFRWHDLLSHYDASELGIVGTEDAETTLELRRDGSANDLLIDLTDVKTLPDFEIPSIAIFFGFPGLQAFSTGEKNQSLKPYLNMPGYTYGWAAFILETIATRDIESTLSHLYFLRAIAGLAEADLKLNNGTWTRSMAERALYENTPYNQQRINLMLNQVRTQPGLFLATIAGKIYFTDLQTTCQTKGLSCEQDLYQQVIQNGPIPFELLEQRLNLGTHSPD